MRPKRKQPEGEEQNDATSGNAAVPPPVADKSVVLYGGVSCNAGALRAMRKPFKVRGGYMLLLSRSCVCFRAVSNPRSALLPLPLAAAPRRALRSVLPLALRSTTHQPRSHPWPRALRQTAAACRLG